MDELFVPRLIELAEKYRAAGQLRAETEEGAVRVRCDKGDFRFFYDLSSPRDVPGTISVPMFHWQQKRRYSELKGLLDRGVVEPALAMRIKHIAPRDGFARTLKALFLEETELFEFVTGGRVNSVFADLCGDEYTNCLLSTDGNIKAAMELGFSPEGSEPVLLHEVVARTGVASDLPVDTQMLQYPIYVLRGGETKIYNEVDFELYGLDNTQADCIRFILWVLSDTSRVAPLQQEHAHLEKVWQAAVTASEGLCRTAVEE